MRPTRKILLFVGLTVLVIAPLSLMLTFLLMPLWRWLEATSGIEAVGHSGPAAWCFVAVFALLGLIGLLTIWREARRELKQVQQPE